MNIKRKDQVIEPNQKGELVIPVAHFAIINSNQNATTPSKIAIYGIGSCIALILYSNIDKIYTMSHILLPSSMKIEQIKFPHKFVNTSCKDLLSTLIENGVNKKEIKAIIIGGAKIFQKVDNNIGGENIKSVLKELKKLKIKIVFKEIGGNKGRSIFFERKSNSILIKKVGERDINYNV